jgi:hypothetical protein
MPKFKVMIDDYTCYGCTIEAEDMDTAIEKFENALEDCEYNYWNACTKFMARDRTCTWLETHWYEEEQDNE